MKLLGDPHLGRSFVHGVPLERRGEREMKQFNQFHADLLVPDGDLHVCMGDLFDKAIVPYSYILWAAEAYAQAASKNPKTHYVILKGNHDWLRDLEKPSAFDLFHRMVNQIPNVHVVTTTYQISDKVFFAWHPTIPADKMVEDNVWNATLAFGHWDIEDYGGDNLNLIPTKMLESRGITKAYTGHIHKPQEFERDNLPVVVVGSMQPYAHGEEINEALYQTVSKKELVEAPAGSFHNKCLRVRLAPGELLDMAVDCLQLTVQKEKEENEPMQVTLGDFDMTKLFKESFAEAGVSEEVTEQMLGKYEASRLSDG